MKNLVQNITSIWNIDIHRALPASRLRLFALLCFFISSFGATFAESGTYGAYLTWTLENGVLTISGTGAMSDYELLSFDDQSNEAPWLYDRASITSIVIDEGVKSIGDWAFRDCRNLTSITIPNSVTNIGRGAFSGCTSLTSVAIPNSVTSIGEYAFSYCENLTSVTIPNSVTNIGSGAFYGCTSLTSVTIPNSVTNIGSGAFEYCTGLTSPVYNTHVFAYMPTSYSGAYTIPDGIESIAGTAFYKCTGLTSVTIPNSVTAIGEWSFSGSSALTSINIPNSVNSIGEGAFSGCTSLTSVAIPNSVSIEPTAFSGCGNLTSITIQEIRFKIYKDKNYYYERNEEYWEFCNDIMWPIGGLPADKLHSLRQCILNAYAFDEVASALSAKVDDPNFHTSLFNTMRNDFVASFDMKYLPSSKVPKNAELGFRGYGMGPARVKNGVYAFFFVWDYVLPGAAAVNEGMHSLNYDMERNRPLALSDILQVDKEAEINRTYRYIVNQWLADDGRCENEFDKDLYFGDKKNWYISDEGIVFTFDLWDLDITLLKHTIVEVTLPLSKYKHLFRPEALKYWANCVESSILLSSELDAANERISQIVQQHNEVINRSPYTQYLNKSERTRFMPTDSPFQIPKAYDYDQAKAFCDSLQRVANSLSQQDPATSIASIKDYLRTTRPDDYVAAYLKENPTAKAHLESEHKEYRCHYASFTDFVLQYEQGRLQPFERNCRELKWQEYHSYYNSREAFNADYDKGDASIEAHKRHYELKWAEYKPYYSSREAFDADYHQGDATLEIHKKREIKWAECADYYEARYIFDFDYDKGETVVDAHRRRIDEAWSSLQQLPEELLVKKKLIGASESKKEDILNLFSLYRQLKPSPHFQSLAADFLISRNKKMGKEYEKNGTYFSSKIAFLTAYFSGDYKHIIKSLKK